MLIKDEISAIDTDKIFSIEVSERKKYDENDMEYTEHGISYRIADNIDRRFWLKMYSTKERTQEVYEELIENLLDSRKVYLLPEE